jgi:hypothetical protein
MRREKFTGGAIEGKARDERGSAMRSMRARAVAIPAEFMLEMRDFFVKFRKI